MYEINVGTPSEMLALALCKHIVCLAGVYRPICNTVGIKSKIGVDNLVKIEKCNRPIKVIDY